MFKKLLSNLPYNPSLIGQVSFYAKRLHNEAGIRRAGFIMIMLALFLQSFAVFSPPQSSLQASPNTDLINGGFSSKDEAVRHCRNDDQDYKKIMNNFGISCDDIAAASVTSINPHDHNDKLYSMGRLSYGTSGETPIRIDGVGKLYARHFWSLNKESSYKVLKVKNSQNKTFYIIFHCGNLVSIGVPAPPPPVDVCSNISGVQTDKEDCDVCPNKSGVQLTTAQCDMCPNKPGVQKDKTCDMCPNKTGVQLTPQECDVCSELPGIQTKETQCRACEKSQTRDDLSACLDYRKTARNITQGIANANGTTAHAGDTIEYTLTTTNKGKVTIKDYVVSEGLGDVLDYADIVDLAGGTKAAYDTINWPAKDIKAGQSLVNKITVRVKNPLPATPASISDPAHFDMKMTNVYGNTVEINLPPPTVIKQTEVITTQLPNTGPGTSLAIGFGLTMFIAYFFARSRLLAKELDTVRVEFASTGGY